MQYAALRHANIPMEYRRVEVSETDLDVVLARLVAEGAGGNVTIPHKERVARRVSRATSVAQRVGAVNTFWTDDGELVGHNTDVAGASATIRALVFGNQREAEHMPVALLGAGGSAAAVLIALHDLGFRDVAVVARTTSRAHALVERVQLAARVVPETEADDVISRAGLIINATPIGLGDDACPVDVARLRGDAAVFDVVYRAAGTPWVRAARQAGHRAEDGLRMLVEQGAAAFEAWFGIPAPRDVMWQALNAEPPAHRHQAS